MITSVPPGYIARAPTRDEAQAIAELIAACQRQDQGKAEMTAEELLSDWAGLDLAEEAVVITTPEGQLAAYADLSNSRYLSIAVYGYVHPDQRGRGLGRYLVHWGEAWTYNHMAQAPQDAAITVRHYILATNTPARQLLEGLAYTAVRGVYQMTIDLDQPPPAPDWPAGIQIRAFTPGRDEQAAFEAYEEASLEMWGRPPNTFDNWLAFTRRADPSLLFIAEAREAIAGVCVTSMVEGRGHVSGLRVRRLWRRQGLGLALLRHSFGEFYRRGARKAALSVDATSPTNAPQLYLKAGMRVSHNFIIYQKELRPASAQDNLPVP
jgi:GNAT superfamily N-acetyltransferase